MYFDIQDGHVVSILISHVLCPLLKLPSLLSSFRAKLFKPVYARITCEQERHNTSCSVRCQGCTSILITTSTFKSHPSPCSLVGVSKLHTQITGASFINKVPRNNLKSVLGQFLGYA